VSNLISKSAAKAAFAPSASSPNRPDPFADSEVTRSPLVTSGLASIKDGRLVLTKIGFDSLAKLQSQSSKSRQPKAKTGVAKNVAWRGELLLTLAQSVERSIGLGLPVASVETLKAAHRALREAKHDVTIPKVRAALQMFRGITSGAEVYDRIAAHRSYGDWWKDLSAEDRATVADKRREALRQFWNHPELAQARREAAAAAMRAHAERLQKEGHEALSRRVDRADALSMRLRSIDKGNLGGETFQFEGVPERMRSSWEALYARVCLASNKRRYVYEPMGFPMIDPATGRVEVYHPDFFELIDRGPGTFNNRVVEIKGELTKTGRRKIELFRRYYLEDDFSGLNEERAKLARALVHEAKLSAWHQFRLRIGSETRFCVFGALPWSEKDGNFVQSRYLFGARCGDSIPGLIPRLMKKYPNLCSKAQRDELKRREKEQGYRDASSGAESWEPVRPIDGSARIARADKLVIDNYSQLRLLVLAKTFETAMQELRQEGVFEYDASFNIRRFMAPFMRDISNWHVYKPEDRKDARLDYERLGAWSASLGTSFIILTSKLLVQHPALRSIGGARADELASVLTRNSSDISQAIVPGLERMVRRESLRQPQLEEGIFALSKQLGDRTVELLNEFKESVASGRLKVDVEFIESQLAEILAQLKPMESIWWGVRASRDEAQLVVPAGTPSPLLGS
jgi:hypothetical protein